jgi:hypothetical protein
VPYTGDVDVHQVLPGLLGYLVRSVAEREDARVRDDGVEATQLRHALVHGMLQCLGVAHVGLRGHDPPVAFLYLPYRLVEVLMRGSGVEGPHAVDLRAEVDSDDVRALLGEPDRVAAPLSSCRAGDERDLAF